MSRNTIPIITKFELAAIISERAIEIADNQPITIRNPRSTNPIEIAKQEFEEKKLPKKIKRVWPDGTVETWSISELRVV